jgi:hypothetical protein
VVISKALIGDPQNLAGESLMRQIILDQGFSLVLA